MGSTTFTSLAVLGLYTETALHCGAESGTGYVDLPVQRERHTGYPVVQGSTIKGVLRDEAWPDLKRNGRAGDRDEKVRRVFGSEDAKEPGTVSFGDGILVAFPVRSSGAPFHWVTCPFALERIFRLLEVRDKLEPPPAGRAWAASTGDVLLEEIHLRCEQRPALFGKGGSLVRLLALLPPGDRGFAYTRDLFLARLLVVGDQEFGELVTTGTEILTRIKLNYLGTTRNLDGKAKEHDGRREAELQGNLFVEEVVPPETLFACPLRAFERSDLLAGLPPVIRLGGDETIGRGITHVSPITPAETGS